MAKVTIEQHEMDYAEFKKRYAEDSPRTVESCAKYEAAQLVVFQQHKRPQMVFVKTEVADGQTKMICLTNVISTAVEVDIKLLQRYKDAYHRKTKLVVFDFPRSILVNECRPSILRFTKLEEDEQPVENTQPFSITQDTYTHAGGPDWLEAALHGLEREQEIHLVCHTPSIEQTISRNLVENHGYRQHRAIYLP